MGSGISNEGRVKPGTADLDEIYQSESVGAAPSQAEPVEISFRGEHGLTAFFSGYELSCRPSAEDLGAMNKAGYVSVALPDQGQPDNACITLFVKQFDKKAVQEKIYRTYISPASTSASMKISRTKP